METLAKDGFAGSFRMGSGAQRQTPVLSAPQAIQTLLRGHAVIGRDDRAIDEMRLLGRQQ